MKPASFNYLRAASAEEAIDALHEFGDDARVLAGGQSLMPMLAMRIAQPGWLIDISRAQDLNYIRKTATHLCIGASTTQATLEWRDSLAQEVPLLKQVFPWISHFQIRNRGTVCGSLAHADPSAELPLSLLVLGGEVVLRSKQSKRVLPAEDFFQGMLQTAIEPDELLCEARFPLRRLEERFGFAEFAQRHGDFAIVSAAAVVTDQSIELAIGGVEDTPSRVQWPMLSAHELDSTLSDYSMTLKAREDPQASINYRRHLVREIGRLAIADALQANGNV